MRWYHWAWVPLVVVVGVVAWVLGKRHGDLATTVATEVNVIEARAEAKRLKAELGAEKARQEIEAQYEDTIAKLDEEQKDRARALRADPVALADLLTRLSAS